MNTLRSLALGLAVIGLSGLALVGCDDGDDDKTTIQSGKHIVTAVGIRTTTNTTGSNFVPEDGLDGALGALREGRQRHPFLPLHAAVLLGQGEAAPDL